MEDTTQKPRTEQTEQPEVIVDADALAETDAALDGLMGDLRSTEAEVTNFTAILSEIEHGHGMEDWQMEGQHDVRKAFDVRDEFVAEHFITMPNDHASIFEMVMRRSEFEQADMDLFEDAPNTSAQKWNKVENMARSSRAPIPETARRKLEACLSS